MTPTYFLFVFIILLIVYVIFYNHETINLSFYDKNESCNMYKKHHFEYFYNFEMNESIIKKCIRDNKNEKQNVGSGCINKYCGQTLNFTKNEKQNIFITLKKLKKIINSNNINPQITFKKLFNSWKFIKVSNDVEDGMPHTVDDAIVLSQIFLDKMSEYIKNKNDESLIKISGTTLIHEYIHVMQKYNQTIFNKLYINYWNFKIINSDILKQINKKNIVTNPDGINNNMGFCLDKNKFVIPMIELKSDAMLISDFKKTGILIENNKIINYLPLYDKQFKKYNDFFKDTHDNYHPNELSAGYISEILLNEYHNHDFNNQAIYKLITWMNIFFINIYDN